MKLFEKGELSLLLPFYLDSLISPLLFFAPAFYIIYFSNLGLSFFQVGLLLAMAPLMALLFEVPTGAIADIYGRKFSVLLGYFLAMLILFGIFITKNYYFILVLFALLGIASTLPSGAKEAWVVDLIKSKNKKKVQSYFAKSQSFDAFALIFSGIIGVFIVRTFGLSSIWLAAAISFSISFMFLLFAKEPLFKRKKFSEITAHSKTSIKYAWGHPIIFYMIVAGFFAMIAVNFGEGIGFIPFLKTLGVPDYAFGYFWSILWTVMIFAPLISIKLTKKNKEIGLIIAATLIGALILLLNYFASNYYSAIIIILLAMFFFGIKTPVERMYFHNFVPSKLRATIGSFQNMILSLASILALPLGGYLIDIIGARTLVILSGILSLPSIIFYLLIKKRQNITSSGNLKNVERII